MKGSNDLAKTKQEIYDGGKRETQFCRLLFCLLDLGLLILQSCAPRTLLLLGWRKETAIYIFTPQARQRQ